MLNKKIFIGISACNEEKYLERCVSSIAKSTLNLNVATYICLNGCKDLTEDIARKCQREYKSLNIYIIYSKIGKINAQKRITQVISEEGPIFFIDADTIVHKKTIKIILRELDKHKELIVVGALPIARRYMGNNLWKKILDEILNVRSRHPKCEISRSPVEDYHIHAIVDPQNKNTNKKHELRSKIFFHGRLFCLRYKKYWKKPPTNKKIVGDDSFLPDYIINRYGKNRIRIRYDAIIYFEPFTSLIKHYNSYKRIYYDLKNLKIGFNKYKSIRKNSSLKLDYDYIMKRTVLIRIKFLLFILIRNIEQKLFLLSKEKNPHNIWTKSKNQSL